MKVHNRIRSYKEAFQLTYTGIDTFSEQLEEILDEFGVERKNRLRIQLSLEEALLRMQEHFGESQVVTGITGTSHGSPFIRLELIGEPFNPLSGIEEELADWGASLLTSVGLSPQYAYTWNKNELRLVLPRTEINPVMKLLIAILVGGLLGVVGFELMPFELRADIISMFLTPVFDVWSRTLNALAGPVIFFMVMTTMLNTQKITEKGGNRRRMFVRYFALCFAVGFVSVVIAAVQFRLHLVKDPFTSGKVPVMLEAIFGIIPENIFEPFTTSNTPQLILLAVVLSNAFMVLGERAGSLTQDVRRFHMTGSLIVEWVSQLVPLFTGLLLALEIWNGQTELLSQIWKPFFMSIVLSAIFFAAECGKLCQMLKVNMLEIIKKIRRPFEMSIKTGSLDASYGETIYSCSNELGIEQSFTAVSLPQGLVLYMPSSIVGILVFTAFAARLYNIETTLQWYIIAVVLGVVLFVATPPVPGANLLAFIAIFQELGIPREALVDAMIFDIVYGIFANAANQALLQIELCQQADRIGLLDRKKIKTPCASNGR